MTKFFRRIRQQLFSDNKVTMYLVYAIGEIFLVVLGILIALQINNWNENKKSREFEREILTQIRTNLDNDKMALKMISNNFEEAISSSGKILREESSQDHQDSLKFWLGKFVQFDRFQPLTNAYEVLKSKGLDQVSHKELRFMLGTYYDDQSSHVTKSIGDIENTFHNGWTPILKSEVIDFRFKDIVVLKDYGILEKGKPTNTLVRLHTDNYQAGLVRIYQVIETIESIQEIIKDELND